MKSKLQARPEFVTIEKNPITLLVAIKQHALSYESTQYRMKTILEAIRNYVNLKQKEDESHLEYLKRSKAAEDVFYSHVGSDFHFPKLMSLSPSPPAWPPKRRWPTRNSLDARARKNPVGKSMDP